MKKYIVCLPACFFITAGFTQTLPTPSKRQLIGQQMETTAFIHFTVNTFTDKEWGDGNYQWSTIIKSFFEKKDRDK